MLRINLLRHLPAPESPAPRAPRGGAGKGAGKGALPRLLGVVLALALIAGGVWFFRYSPYGSGFVSRDATPVEVAEPAPVADSARMALEALAVSEIAALQRAAVHLSFALEPFLPGSASLPKASRAVLSPPDGFLLRGEAASPEALSRFQESLVLVPGLDLARSESRAAKNARLEFIFAGTLSPEPAEADSLEPADSSDLGDLKGPEGFEGFEDSANSTTPVAPAPVPLLDAASLERAWATFLEDAAAAGVEFTVLPAGPPTASGSLQAHPYRVQATCKPAQLRAFLASPAVQGSPFGIRRLAWEINSGLQLVSLDIMAFSH